MGKRTGMLGPLGVVTLALLVERPMHPYEMYQLLIARGEDSTVKVRPGTLYHVVGSLADAGYIEAVGTDRDGNRPERTTYAITDTGRAAVEKSVISMLEDAHNEYPEFVVAMSEAHNLAAADVTRVLRHRVAALEAQCAVGDSLMARANARGLPRRFVLGGEFALNRARHDIAWIAAVIDEIDSGSLSWDEPVPPTPKDIT